MTKDRMMKDRISVGKNPEVTLEPFCEIFKIVHEILKIVLKILKIVFKILNFCLRDSVIVCETLKIACGYRPNGIGARLSGSRLFFHDCTGQNDGVAKVDSPIVILQQDEAKELLKIESPQQLYRN